MDVFTPVAPRGTVVGRYALYEKMATAARAEVWLGRVRGHAGAPLRAVKRLHRELLSDPLFVSTAVAEARRSSTLEHPNLAPFRDVALIEGRELLLVADCFPGESLAMLFGVCFRSNVRMPLPVAIGIVAGILRGLEAAHEARDASGASLGIVHGGLSPHNVMVGTDGIPRVVDFGLAIARSRAPATAAVYSKGKGAYMSPEQVRHDAIDRRTDIYAAAVILWELIAGERLFRDTGAADVALQITSHLIPQLRELHPEVPAQIDEVLNPALARKASARPGSAAALGAALEVLVPPASAIEIGSWVRGIARDRLAEQAELFAEWADAPDPPASGGDVITEAAAAPPYPWAVHAPALRSQPRKRGARHAALLISALAVGLVLVKVLRGARSNDGPEAPVAHGPTPTAAASTPPATSARAAPAVAPRAPAAAPVQASAEAGHAPAAPASAPKTATERRTSSVRETRGSRPAVPVAAKVAPRPTRPARRRRATQHRASVVERKAHCQPPFTVDAQGIRRIKPECLK
jgi:hypothetical protein